METHLSLTALQRLQMFSPFNMFKGQLLEIQIFQIHPELKWLKMHFEKKIWATKVPVFYLYDCCKKCTTKMKKRKEKEKKRPRKIDMGRQYP